MMPALPHARSGAVRAAGTPRGSLVARGVAVLMALLLAAFTVVAPGAVATAEAVTVPYQPGVTQPGTEVFDEDFETAAAGYSNYSSFVGEAGMTYTGSPNWTNAARCNGVIGSYADVPTPPLPSWLWTADGSTIDNNGPFRCSFSQGVTSVQFLRLLARAMGEEFGGGLTNNIVSEYTECNNTNNTGTASPSGCPTIPAGSASGVMLRTQSEFPVTPGHYYSYAIDTAYVNCAGAGNPSFQFAYFGSGLPVTTIGTPLNGCLQQNDSRVTTTTRNYTLGPEFGLNAGQSKTVYLSRMVTDAAVQFTGSTMGLTVWNNQSATAGNDGSFDNIRVIDVTPQVDKSFAPAVISTGQTSQLTFTVTNTDELNAKPNWTFTDALPAGLTVASPSGATTTCLNAAATAGSKAAVTAAGGSISVTGSLGQNMASCTITVNVTSAVAGTYTNTGCAAATGEPVPGCVSNFTTISGLNPAGETKLTVIDPSIEIVKTAAAGAPVDVDGNGVDAGDTIAYTFVATNTSAPVAGADSLSNVRITDPMPGLSPLACSPTQPATLARGAAMTCTATYALTQADVDAGSVTNTATAVGDASNASTVTDADSEVVTYSPLAALAFDKQADVTTVDAVGDVITYTFTATNTGPVALTQVTIADPMPGLAPLACAPAQPAPLAPGASMSCTATYSVTQGDVDAGSITNTASADSAQTTPVADTVTVPGEQDAAIEVVKSADLTTDVTVGDVVTYTVVATNTGNVALSNVSIADTDFSGSGSLSAFDCAPAQPATLAPGDALECTATYAVTAADVDAGTISNTAAAIGTPPTGDPVTDSDDEIVTAAQVPGMELVKRVATVVDVNGDGLTNAGDEIRWEFDLTNTGDVTLADLAVEDALLAAAGIAVTCAPDLLAPGASVTCVADASYVITAADVEAGEVVNVATAAGTPPGGGTTTSPPGTTTTPVDPSPGLALDKRVASTVDVDGDGVIGVDDEIWWEFELTNTGDVMLTNAAVADALLDSLGVAITCDVTVLVPGEVTLCAADAAYVVTQADVDAGLVANTATASAEGPDGSVDSNEDTTSTPLDGNPGLDLVKRVDSVVDVNGNGLTDAGDEIRWAFDLTNTGALTLADVRVDDPMLDALGIGIVCDLGPLAPGASLTCLADSVYVITADDVAAGVVANTATAAATMPDGEVVDTPESATQTPVDRRPGLDLIKRVASVEDVNGNGLTDAGDEIRWEFDLTNTGNVPLTHLGVQDALLTDAGISVTCAANELAIGESLTCAADRGYVISAHDVVAGQVVNVATATGTPPGGGDPGNPGITSPPDTTVTQVDQDPELLVAKRVARVEDVNGNGITDAGDEIWWEFALANTGDVTLTNLRIADDMLTEAGIAVGCPGLTLGPGKAEICAATEGYVITAADAAAGEVYNVATASGTLPGGGSTELAPPSDTTTQVNAPIPDPPPAAVLPGQPEALPFTGSSPLSMMVVAVLLVGFGVVAAVRGRMRRAES